jgi:hypothetical protein
MEWAPLDEAGLHSVGVRLRRTAICLALALVAAMTIASGVGVDVRPAGVATGGRVGRVDC